MIKCVVENTTEESVTVDGLGVLLPKEILEVSAEATTAFEHIRGLKLAQAHLPAGIELYVMTSDTVEGM